MVFSIIFFLIASARAFPVDQNNLASAELRLIELSPGVREYMTLDEVLRTKERGINFMDITDHPETNQVTFYSETREAANIPLEVHESTLFNNLSTKLSKGRLESELTKLTSFYTRYAKSDTGLESSLWVYNKTKEFAGSREDVDVILFDHDWQQKSVIVRIEGTENKEKVVVVGSHQDSINLLLPNILPAPGADDDGSGTVTTLEVLRILLANSYRPKNTLEFHYYSAEELGLLGSQDVFADYSARGVNVRTMLQQDMTGYSAGSQEHNNGRDELGVITDYVDKSLTEFIKLLITEYCDIPYVETTCGYACSDHGSATKYGYQSAFVIESAFENINNKIHTTEDKVEFLDFDHMLQHAKLTLGYALELGNALDL